jgi:hypothetical protein
MLMWLHDIQWINVNLFVYVFHCLDNIFKIYHLKIKVHKKNSNGENFQEINVLKTTWFKIIGISRSIYVSHNNKQQMEL